MFYPCKTNCQRVIIIILIIGKYLVQTFVHIVFFANFETGIFIYTSFITFYTN